MLLVLAALGICVGYMCCVVLDRHLVICVYVVLDRHLVVCVGYMFMCVVLVFIACCTVAICEVGCLART